VGSAPPPWPVEVHRVVSGESLWSIAQDALAHRWGREPTDAEVLPYWERVIEHNRAALADPDNPDLLFPGDEVRLPAPTPEA
jgi:nucleoid-associated protein YgaU